MTVTEEQLFEAYEPDEPDAAWLRMNFVSSADGAVTVEGRSGGLGGGTDRRLMAILRSLSDAILVGAGTVRAEGYGGLNLPDRLVDRRRDRGLADRPRLVIASAELDLQPTDPVFSRAEQRPIIITGGTSPAAQRERLAAVADVHVFGDGPLKLDLALRELAAAGLRGVLCEGGPHLFGSLLHDELVDEVCLTVAPRFVGGDAGRIVQCADELNRRFRLRSCVSDDEGFVFLRYSR